MSTNTSIEGLQEMAEAGISKVENELLNEHDRILNWKAQPEQWSVLECIEHLNKYARYYNHEIEKALAKKRKPQKFKAGWLGNYFVESVTIGSKPVKTLSRLNPLNSQLDKGVLDEYLMHQRHLLQLLQKAKHNDLNARAVKVELMKWIRIKTGDALRFVITHQERHLAQALRAKKHALASRAVPAKGYRQNTAGHL
jgi:hypothetical protein